MGQTKLDKARKATEVARELVADWEQKATAAEAEAERLEEGAGAALLDNPAGAAKLRDTIAQHRADAELARKAAEEARTRVLTAVRAELDAEAAEHETEARKLMREVEAFDAREAELLAPLAAHYGCPVTVEPESSQGDAATGLGAVTYVSERERLEQECGEHVRHAACTRYVLRRGELPTMVLDVREDAITDIGGNPVLGGLSSLSVPASVRAAWTELRA